MEITKLVRDILIYSAVLVVVIALIIFAIILFKVHKIRMGIKKETLDIISQDSVIDGHLQVVGREDFGEPIYLLRDIVDNPLDDEIVEFSINTIIKNKFEKILMLGHKTPYELITISNKTHTTIDILFDEFNKTEYDDIISKSNYKHDLRVIDEINTEIQYDVILLLSSRENYLPIYEKHIKNLRKNGMFLIANVTKNKVWKKEIVKKIMKTNLKYDILKWYKGFILIVK
ncbi:MAG: hypothetical protein KFW07_01415 [Mycoplasmataceae bacterium]|nr:hypothetical protein [Mycoplasmataceae bacterium]